MGYYNPLKFKKTAELLKKRLPAMFTPYAKRRLQSIKSEIQEARDLYKKETDALARRDVEEYGRNLNEYKLFLETGIAEINQA